MACYESVVKSDITECSICLEAFKKPKTLPCSHIFCQACLSGYILSDKSDNSKKQGFNCPICRTFTPLNRDIDIANWVSELPENCMAAENVGEAKTCIKETMDDTVDCQSCLRDNKHVKALYFCFHCYEQICRECREYHLKMKAQEHHSITDLESVETGKKQKTKLVTDCVLHPGKEIEYFCHDHKKLCCSKCLFVTHRKCSEVAGVEDCLGKFKGDANLSEIVKTTDLMLDGIHEIQKCDTDVLATLNNDVETVPQILGEYRKYILEQFEQTFSRIATEAKKRYTEQCEKIRDHLEVCNRLESDLENVRNVAQIVAEHGNDIQQFVAARQFDDTMETHTAEMGRITCDTALVTIKPSVSDDYKRQVAELDKHFSVKLNVSSPKLSKTYKPKSNQVRCVQFLSTFSCTIPSDESVPRITGICFTSDSRSILLDQAMANRTLKLYCPNHTLLSFHKIDVRPWNVVCLKDSHVAVSFACNKINIYNIINNVFIHVKEVTITKTDGLISLSMFTAEESIAATCSGHIERVSVDGTSPSPAINIPLEGISAVGISPDGDSMYAVSETTDNLVMTDKVGNIKQTYSDLKTPLSLAVHPSGDLFVCSTYGHELIQLTPDLQLIQKVITGDDKKRPLHVAFNNEVTEMWVSFDRSESVSIYNLR